MWVFTTAGFYSVVAHRTRPGYVLVRARTRVDLEALNAWIPDLEVFEDQAADYRWRVEATTANWQNALASLGGTIDYDKLQGRGRREAR